MIEIYRKNENGNPVLANTISDKNATLNREIMGRDEMNISIVSEAPLDIRMLDYILVETDFTEYENKPVTVAYTINRPPDVVKKSEVEYQYTLIFESPLYNLMDKLVLNPMTRQSRFSLNGTLADFARLLLDNINTSPDNPAGTDSGWTVRGLGNPDLFPETTLKVLAFESTSCRDLLNRLSGEFGIEFYLRDKEIVFTDQIQNETGLTFEQGKGKGLYSLSRKNVDTSNTVTRAYLFGGSKNLPPRHTDPVTGQEVPIYRDGAERLTIDKGYIECFDNYAKVVERDVIFEDIFPRFEGAVQNVKGENNTFVVCDMIDFDAEKYKIGTQSTVNFLSGALMGMAFPFNYDHSTHTIKLIRQEYDLVPVDKDETPPLVPNDLIKPAVGDTFNFLDIIMPPSYITNAENRLLEEGQRWFARYNKLRVKYDLEIDHRYLRDQDLKLHPGDIIGIGQPDGLPTGQKLRVTAISTQLNTGKISCTLSNYITQSWEKQIEGAIQQNSQSAQIREEKAGNAILSTTKEWVGRNFARLWGGNRIASEQHFTDNIYVGNDRVKSDVYIQGNVAYHSGNANNGNTDWKAKDILSANLSASGNTNTGTLTASDKLTVGGTTETATLRVKGNASAAAVETNSITVDGTIKAKTAIFGGDIESRLFNTGPLGDGWQISESGDMEGASLKLRDFLEVPTLQYNKITVIGSEFWISDGGVIETVEALPGQGFYNVGLKLENGDPNPFVVDDILRGYFFSGGAFKVVRFYVKEITGQQTMQVESCSPADVPMPFMNIARMGNTDDNKPERQRSVYLSGRDGYIRFLDKVNDFEISNDMISMQLGNLDKFTHKLFGDCSGYSAFLENILMTGRVLQRSADGQTLKPLPVFKGAWEPGEYYPYDEVTHSGSRWLCVATESTSSQPAGDSPDWLKTVDKGDKGDTGTTGNPGDTGSTIRMRGHWQRDPEIPYTSDTSWRDVVQFGEACYIVRPGHTVSGQTSPDVDTQNWEQFNEFENIVTHVLLAGQGNIDVLGAGELFVGQTKNGAGWKMTGGKIAHTTSGLSLTACGKLNIPNGSLTISNSPVDDELASNLLKKNRNLLHNSSGNMSSPPWLYASDITDGVFRLENRTDKENYFYSPHVKLDPLTTYSISFRYRSFNIKSGEILVLPDDYENEKVQFAHSFESSSDWTEVNKTFTTNDKLKNLCMIRFDINGALQKPGTDLFSWLEVSDIMIVQGNEIGQWTPAPEDTGFAAQQAIQDIGKIADDNIFSSTEKKRLLPEWSAIVQENTALLENAGKYNISTQRDNYLYAYSALFGYVNAFFSNDDINLDSPHDNQVFDGSDFRSKFANFYVSRNNLLQKITEEGKKWVDNMVVDGRNRLLRSGTPFTVHKFDNIANQVEYTGWFIPQECAGKKMLVSFDITFQNVVKAANATLRFQCDPMAGYAGFNTGSVGIPANGSFHIKTYITFTTINDARSQLGIRFDYISSGLISVSNMKIEEGDKHTGWTAAPEDEREQLPIGRNLIANSSGKDTALADKRPRSIFSPTIMEANVQRGVSVDGYYELSPSILNTGIGLFHQWGGWAGQNDTVAPYEDFYTLSFEYRFSERPRISSANNALLTCRAYLGAGETGEDGVICSADYNYTPGVWHRMVMTMDLKPHKEKFLHPDIFFVIRLCNLYAFFQNQFWLSFRNIKLETGNVATPWKPDDENYYLREALAGNTTVDGGLVTTSIIKLGSASGEKAGISGLGSSPVRAWFGGTYQNALSDPANVGCIFYNDGSGQLSKGGIKWESNGNLKVNAEITATSGTIGGFNIIQNAIQARQEGKTRLLIDTGDVPPKSQLSTVVNDSYPLYLYIKRDFIGIDGPEYILDPDNNYAHTIGWDREGPAIQIDNSKIDLYTEILNLPAGRSVSFNLGIAYTRKITLYNPNKLTGDPAFADLYTMQVIAPDGSVLQSNLNFRQGIVEFNTHVAGDYKITLKGTAVLDKANADANIRSAYTTITFSIPANIILSTTFDSRTIIGTNGMTSFWGTDNYLYYSKTDGFEVKKGANSLIVDAGGVKVKQGTVEMPVNPVICGGTVDKEGGIINKTGYQPFNITKGINGTIKIEHGLNHMNYMVIATVRATEQIYQSNLVTVINQTKNYIEIKGKNSNGSDVFTPFYFLMLATE